MSSTDETVTALKHKILIGLGIAAGSIGGYYLYSKFFNSSSSTKVTKSAKNQRSRLPLDLHHKIDISSIAKEFERTWDKKNVPISEFSTFLDALVVNPQFGISKERKEEFLAKMADVKKSEVSLLDFQRYLTKPTKIMDFGNLERLFDKYDTDHNGVIDSKELRTFLDDWTSSKGIEKVTDKQLISFITYLDQTGKGGLQFTDFRRWAVKFSDEFKWKKIHDFFNKYTHDKTSMDQTELLNFLTDMSRVYKVPQPSIAQTQLFFEKIDRDHNGSITYTEFALWLSSLEDSFKKEFNPRELFDLFDEDQNGKLDFDEWSHFMSYLSRIYGDYAPSEEKISQWLDTVDSDRSGDISFDEFNVWYQQLKRLPKK